MPLEDVFVVGGVGDGGFRLRQVVRGAEFGEEELGVGEFGAVGGSPAGDELLDLLGVAGSVGHEGTEYIGERQGGEMGVGRFGFPGLGAWGCWLRRHSLGAARVV